MRSEIYAAFTLTGSTLDPVEITAKVGIPPTKTWRTGDLTSPKSKSIMRHEQNGWSLRSRLEKSAELEDHVKSVLEQLQPGWHSLVDVCSHYDAEIECVIYTSERPAIHFDRPMLEQIAKLNAEIDVDLYVLPEGW